MKDCIGSGFCCFMERCYASQLEYGEEIDDCPDLVFKDNRYWCDMMNKKPSSVKHMMGEGCGAPWNKWRESVKKRIRKEYIKYYDEEALTDLVRYYDPRRKKTKN